MPPANSGLRSVLTGGDPSALEWEVLAGPDGHGFTTMIRRRRGTTQATSGFKGPKLEAGQSIRFWFGSADGFPLFVLLRTAPDIREVVVTGQSGIDYPIRLTEVIADFGLRFGAVPMWNNDYPAGIRTIPKSKVPEIHPPRNRPPRH